MRFSPLFAAMLGLSQAAMAVPAIPQHSARRVASRDRTPGKPRPSGSKLARLASRGRIGVWSAS